MRFHPTPTHGRIVTGDTPYGKFRVEWAADGTLISESIEIREPEPEPVASRGLGDTVAKITKAIGVRPCGGCSKRQATLNRLVPYR